MVYAEARTFRGELVTFACDPEVVERIKQGLSAVESIEVATTRQVDVAHGGYGSYTRHHVVQHRYAGGGSPGFGGYTEVLEIKNPPDGRCGFVVNAYHHDLGGNVFYEFRTLKQAIAAWERSDPRSYDIAKRRGFLREVECGELTPWFYATADQALMGDFVAPTTIHEEEPYRFGRKFVARDKDGLPTIRTCVGIHHRQVYGGTHRFVQWMDGSVTDLDEGYLPPPRLLEESELWISEVVNEFRKLLGGRQRHFRIKFSDGCYFFGQVVVPPVEERTNAGGKYKVRVRLNNGSTHEGTIWFHPDKVCPTLDLYLIGRKIGRMTTIVAVEAAVRIDEDKENWDGVFANPFVDR